MERHQSVDILREVSDKENTLELKNYWYKRYSQVLEGRMFALSQETQLLFDHRRLLPQPATVYGGVILMKHLDKNGLLDEIELQNTIEASVRFLDSLLDVLDLTAEARMFVEQYRRIGIGILDYQAFADHSDQGDNAKLREYISSFVSNSSYRASETLAEEKGSCKGWDKIKYHIRPKPFEYWYNTKTGEIRSSVQISEEWTQETIQNSDFEIVPRRNAALLAFPQTEEWMVWSDRDQSSPKVEVHNETKPEKQPDILQAAKLESTTQVSLTANETNSNINPEIKKSEENDPLLTAPFGVGELVLIDKENSPYHNKVYQIVKVAYSSAKSKYIFSLSGGDSRLESIDWYENELKQVDIKDIVNKLNIDETADFVPDRVSQVYVSLIIVESNNFLTVRVGDDVYLPSVELENGDSIERAVGRSFYKKYGLRLKNVSEIGSAIERVDENSAATDYRLFLGISAELDNPPQSFPDGMFLVPKSEANRLNPSSKILLNKFQTRQKIASELHRNISISPQTSTNDEAASSESKTSNLKLKLKPEYTIKIERNIQINTNSEVVISLRLGDTNKRGVFEALGKNTSPEFNFALQTVVGSINIMLGHGVLFGDIKNSFTSFFEQQNNANNSKLTSVIDAMTGFPNSIEDIVMI